MAFRANVKIGQYINYRVRIILHDSRTLIGTLKSFDKYMNLILDDCEDVRRVKPKNSRIVTEEKRHLGFILLRGENIQSITLEGPQPSAQGPSKVHKFPKGLAVSSASTETTSSAMHKRPTGFGGYTSQQVMTPIGLAQVYMPSRGRIGAAGPSYETAHFPNMAVPPPRLMSMPPMIGRPPGVMGVAQMGTSSNMAVPPPRSMTMPPPGMMIGRPPGITGAAQMGRSSIIIHRRRQDPVPRPMPVPDSVPMPSPVPRPPRLSLVRLPQVQVLRQPRGPDPTSAFRPRHVSTPLREPMPRLPDQK